MSSPLTSSDSLAPGTPTSMLPQAPPPPPSKSTLFKEIACNSTMVIGGWSDASAGPLLPYIQAYYGISYTVVSTLFIGQMIGFLAASFLNAHLTEKYGLGKVITLGALIQVLGYVFLVPALPYPVMPICYSIIGLGMALQDAGANTYIATLSGSQQKFGFLHASYGLGGLVCPLIATAFVSSGIRFSYFYATSIVLSCINAVVLLAAFRFNYRVEEVEEEGVEMEMERIPGELESGETITGERREKVVEKAGLERKERGKLELTLRSKHMWLCAIFGFVYVGAEVAMGGWIITFLVDARGGGPSAGYVASGFWGGITLGRAILPWFTEKVGERRVVFLYLLIAFALEFTIWFAQNLIANAVAVGLVGFVLGPLYPITMVVAVRVIPRSLHSSAIGFIAAFGQTGSAVFPFMVGALAQRFDTTVLQPVMIALFSILTGLWWFVPAVDKKRE